MEEIFRYQQLRQTQKLSEEQKQQIGLSLYADETLSVFANDLKKSDGSKEKYDSILARFKELNHGKNILEDSSKLDPIVLSLYNWLNYKSRPIRLDEFKKNLQALSSQEVDLKKLWALYADNLIIAIHNQKLSTNYCLDYQLLIRICYLLKLVVEFKKGRWFLKDNITADMINAILELPILLPKEILRSRCSEKCVHKGKTEWPDSKIDIDGHDRTPCECECDDSCQKPSYHCICLKTYIADLFIIKEELARYEESDIAHIENVLAGESKVRRHRNLYRTEDTTENETETIANEERDHQVSEKFSLQAEVKKTVDTKVGVDAGVTATIKYGPSVTITPHANVSVNYSKSQADNIARSYAKDVVDRSVSKIQEKIRRVQISKAMNELEERNKHSIDNSLPDSTHRAGIYYWVNKVTHAQVFNYGKHMMFDVIVPEPAAIFKKLFQLKINKDKEKGAPKKPNITPKTITRFNYGDLLNEYAISTTEDIQPPDEFTSIQFAFSHNFSEEDSSKTRGFSSHEFKSPEIPAGYKAKKMNYQINCSTGHPKMTDPARDEVAITVNVGSLCIFKNHFNEENPHQGHDNYNWWEPGGSANLNGEEGILSVAVAGFSTLGLSLSGTISITCELKTEAAEKWQSKVYNLIMAEYNRRLEAYEAGENKNSQLIQIKGRNPFLNREIERNEFKRHIIAILMCNYFNGIGSMMEKVSPCGYPEINFAKLEKDTPIIQFFEQVFEWNYLTYLFYHSMWARKCKWADLIDEDSGDPLFDKFLMSGAARVQIPIRPGMEEIFSWFLKTGQLWGASGNPPVSGDDEYISMIQELKESKQCDYTDRLGLIQATNGSNILILTESTFYWDLINDQLHTLNLDNDKDREILIDFEKYRIVKVEQTTPGDKTAWNITIERPYETTSASNLKHAVGAIFVGAPWEIIIPTKLVYLRNNNDKLPTYPLT